MAPGPWIPSRMKEICLPIMQQHDGGGNRPTSRSYSVPTSGQVPACRVPDGILQSHLPQPVNFALPIGFKGFLWCRVLKRAQDTASLGLTPNSITFSRQFKVVWSCRSPRATLMAITGAPSLRTRVGARVIRGRLPASMRLGCPGVVLRLRRRLPLGVAETKLPH